MPFISSARGAPWVGAAGVWQRSKQDAADRNSRERMMKAQLAMQGASELLDLGKVGVGLADRAANRKADLQQQIARQRWATGERLGEQEWSTGERLGEQGWQAAEDVKRRYHEALMEQAFGYGGGRSLGRVPSQAPEKDPWGLIDLRRQEALQRQALQAAALQKAAEAERKHQQALELEEVKGRMGAYQKATESQLPGIEAALAPLMSGTQTGNVPQATAESIMGRVRENPLGAMTDPRLAALSYLQGLEPTEGKPGLELSPYNLGRLFMENQPGFLDVLGQVDASAPDDLRQEIMAELMQRLYQGGVPEAKNPAIIRDVLMPSAPIPPQSIGGTLGNWIGKVSTPVQYQQASYQDQLKKYLQQQALLKKLFGE